MKTQKHLARCAAFSLVTLVCATHVHAAGFGIYEAGTRPLGLAGAFTGLADNATAIFFNPAGLATQTGISLDGNVALIAPSFAYQTHVPGGEAITLDAKNQLFVVPSIYANYRVHERVAVGFGMYAPFGLGVEWPASFNQNGQQVAWWGRDLIKKIDLQVVSLNLSTGIKLHDRVYIGGGFVVTLGAVTLERSVMLNKDPADDIDVKLSGDDVGFGGTAGLLVKVIPNLLNFGFSFRSGTSLAFAGNVAFSKNGSPDNIAPALRGRLTDGRVEAPLTLPHTFSFGVTGFPMERLLVSFNFDVITWSSYEKLAVNFLDNPALTTSERKSWSNTFQLRVGAEYQILKGNLPIRLGFIYDQSPAPDDTVGPELPDTDRYWFAFGLGYKVAGVDLNLAYQFLLTGEDATTEAAPIVGSRSAGAHIFSLGLGYNFAL